MDLLNLRQVFSDRWLRNVTLMIFAILCANKFDFQLTGGEEQYVAFAKQYLDPTWIPESFTLTEFAGTRWLFQVVNFPLLQFLDVGAAALVGRLINFFFLSVPLALIFRKLNFRWELVLFLMQLFVMSKQSFFAGEWIFDGYEPKSVAYIFVFYGLYFALENKLLRSAVFVAIATYFHVLVGGWFFLCLLVIFLFSRPKETLVKFILPYGLVLLPFAVYLFSGYFGISEFESELNLDRIYCYYRLPHHLGIFYSNEYFVEHHLTGVLVSAIVLVIAVIFQKRIPENLHLLVRIMIVALSINLIFVGVAWLDVNVADYRLSAILKYYPFRTNSLAMLIFFWIVGAMLLEKTSQWRRARILSKVLVVISLLLATTQVVNNIIRLGKQRLPDGYAEMCEYIEANTPGDSEFILVNIPVNDLAQIQFIRKSQRESFAVYKFVSAEKEKLDEWYKRQKLLYSINTDNSLLDDLNGEYAVEYALSSRAIDGYGEVRHFGDLYLYELSERVLTP